jgi:group I intron endonuclease
MKSNRAIICGIYKITNPLSKVYIGKSMDIKKRWLDHKRMTNHGTVLNDSLKKYGVENHVFEIVKECQKNDLTKEEAKYIGIFNESHNMMNYIRLIDRKEQESALSLCCEIPLNIINELTILNCKKIAEEAVLKEYKKQMKQ